MDVQLLNYLQCPRCRKVFSLSIFSKRGDEIEEGMLNCQCGEFYPVIRGIPRFVPEALAVNPEYVARNAQALEAMAKKTSRTFFVRTAKGVPFVSARFIRLLANALELRRIDTNERSFIKRTGLYPEEIAGKMVLDVESGCGCLASFAAGCGAVVIAVDRRPWIHITRTARQEAWRGTGKPFWIQADYTYLPFGRQQFDFIYSSGELSNAKDDRAALRALLTHLQPDGRISLRLFRKMGLTHELINGMQRCVTTGIPPALLLFLCFGAVPVGFLKRYLSRHKLALLRLLGRLISTCAPGISVDIDAQMRIFETFQWYGEKYQWHRAFADIRDLLQAEGFQGVKRLKAPQTEETTSPDAFLGMIARRTPF
jgi:uncharacterized protein YbaR (Trm112 family)/ubiquinone/menaquinone biosynthesis C-methylase UbiE